MTTTTSTSRLTRRGSAAPEHEQPTPLTLAAVTALGWLPGWALAATIDDRVSIIVAAIAAVGAAATSLGLAALDRRRHIGWIAAVAVHVIAAAAVAAIAVVIWPDPRRSAPLALVDAVGRGWAEIASAPAPATATPRLVVPLLIVVWLAVALGWAIARRQAGGSRLAAVVPATVAVVFACVAAGSHQHAPVVTGVAFIVLAALAIGERSSTIAGRRASAAAPVGLIAVVAVIAAVAGPPIASGRSDDPFDPREHLAANAAPAGVGSPLDLVSVWLQQPDEELFVVHADEPVLTRLATFDRFDGTTWSVSGGWVPAGTSGPTITPRGVPTEHVSANIELRELDGRWLPSLDGWPTVNGIATLVNRPSGAMTATAEAIEQGTTYTVSTDVTLADPAALADRAAGGGRDAEVATALPSDPPPLLVEMADTATGGATTPFWKAVRLQRYLRTFALDPDHRAGHTYGHLLRSLTVDGSGTSEQFATGFAVLGRIAGLPTRVVVGFGPVAPDDDGTAIVRSGDVRVWPEVLFDGVGWVAFDPTPTNEAADDGDDGDVLNIGGQQVRIVPPTTTTTTTTTTTVPDSVPPPPAPEGDDGSNAGGSMSWQWPAIVVVVALAATAVSIPALKAAATRRRRHGDGRQRVIGAWHDVLDRLHESGDADPGARTVAEHVATVEHGSSMTMIERPVAVALYGDGPVDTALADTAWRGRDEFVRARAAGSGLLTRLRRAFDPRPLLRRRRND